MFKLYLGGQITKEPTFSITKGRYLTLIMFVTSEISTTPHQFQLLRHLPTYLSFCPKLNASSLGSFKYYVINWVGGRDRPNDYVTT